MEAVVSYSVSQSVDRGKNDLGDHECNNKLEGSWAIADCSSLKKEVRRGEEVVKTSLTQW
jgi:hypothetical protein